MPDLRLTGQELERIAHYLLRHTRAPGNLSYTLYRGDVWEGLDSDNVKTERAGLVKDFAPETLGNVRHHTAIRYEGWLNIASAGRYTCSLQMNGGSLLVDGNPLIQQKPSNRRGVRRLEGATDLATGWRGMRLVYFQTGHEPAFSLEMEGPNCARSNEAGSPRRCNRNGSPKYCWAATASGHKEAVRAGDRGEVLIPLTLPKGRSTLTLESR